MSKISEIGMAESQPVGDLERWKALEREAATRAATLHCDLRIIAETLGVTGVADEKRLREEILKVIAQAKASHEPDNAAQGGKNRLINDRAAELTQVPTLGVPGGLESAKLEMAPLWVMLDQLESYEDEYEINYPDFSGRDELAILDDRNRVIDLLMGWWRIRREDGTNWEEVACFSPAPSKPAPAPAFRVASPAMAEMLSNYDDPLAKFGFGSAFQGGKS